MIILFAIFFVIIIILVVVYNMSKWQCVDGKCELTISNKGKSTKKECEQSCSVESYSGNDSHKDTVENWWRGRGPYWVGPRRPYWWRRRYEW